MSDKLSDYVVTMNSLDAVQKSLLVPRIRGLEQALQDSQRENERECEWSYDEHSESWDSECGHKWQFVSGGPIQNECHFCMYCGGRLIVEGEKISC